MKNKVQVLLLLFISALPVGVMADTLTAYCRDYPPELLFENGQCAGPVPDLVADVFAQFGFSIKWVQQPPLGRSVRQAKQGRIDLLIRHSMTAERREALHPVQYASPTRHLFFYKSPKFKSDIDTYDALKNVNVGAIRNVFYSPSFAKLESKKLIFVDKTEQLLALLELGRIDVAVTSVYHYVELFATRFEKASLEDSFTNPMYVSISKKSKVAKYHNQVAALMLEYRKSGKVAQYFEKYGLPAPAQTFDHKL
ncbi:transporter substrate-binding domain-containing protein [Paraglaciecola aquimarina]|uniref:Transporter substrate-binding domain-containing protein n=1 Tax=Paraglaciecola aquimarina TaxID=1235557 RepID=A0ABU3SV91_9ALTE|nr:transporter substrate-binding domain-containing protein [Paraglaciecola aquimarina]MDU0353940.1 transporter substrate-binding domain-containing protein [Paraglaciecola aquimarina]